MPTTPSRESGKRSGFKTILLTILGIVCVGFFSFFTIMVGYYFWKIHSGDAAQLQKKFYGEFTRNPDGKQQDASDTIEGDVTQYIYSSSPQIGNPDAPITILAFIDFECPYCQKAYPIFEEILAEYGSAIRVIFKHFPIESIHPHAMDAAIAAACAQDQNAFWEFYRRLFDEKQLAKENLLSYAIDLNLNLPLFQQCFTARTHESAILKDMADGVHLDVPGTPTYIVNNQKVVGVPSKKQWTALLLQELQK